MLTDLEVLAKLPARIADRIDTSSSDGCWPWRGTRLKGKVGPRGRYGQYGTISPLGTRRDRGSPKLVHRLVLEADIGPLPAGQKALHTCDNAPCARRSHLFAGTSRDNIRDMMAKGRARFGGRTIASVV